MNETVEKHARKGYRRVIIVAWMIILLLGGLLGVAIHRFRTEGELFPIILFLEVFLIIVLPVIRVEEELQLATDRSSAAVREEFKTGDHPLAAWSTAQADDGSIEAHENGVSCEISVLFGLRTVTIGYETEQQSNDDLLVRTRKNGNESVRNTVSIEAADEEGTKVTVISSITNRKHLWWLFLTAARGGSTRSMFRALGYEVIDSTVDTGLRKS